MWVWLLRAVRAYGEGYLVRVPYRCESEYLGFQFTKGEGCRPLRLEEDRFTKSNFWSCWHAQGPRVAQNSVMPKKRKYPIAVALQVKLGACPAQPPARAVTDAEIKGLCPPTYCTPLLVINLRE